MRSPNYRVDMCCSFPVVLTNILIWSRHLGACQCAQLRPRKSGKSPLPSQLRETWSSGGSEVWAQQPPKGPGGAGERPPFAYLRPGLSTFLLRQSRTTQAVVI